MIKFNFIFCLVIGFTTVTAQDIDPDLLKIRQRMETIEEFSADLTLDLEVSFINMPTKTADMHFIKDKPVKFSSDDFVLIPKRGLDFSMNELFKYDFITVDRGEKLVNGITYRVINIIPTDKKADFAIATLVLDIENYRIIESEITTKKDGSYTLTMQYANSDMLLPERVEVSFEINRIKIPLNFMGKETEVDREELKSEDPKTGKIILSITNYKINYSEG